MEQLNVLGYYFGKFEKINTTVILAVMNRPNLGIVESFDKNKMVDRDRLRKALKNMKMFNKKELEILEKTFQNI